MTEHVIQDVTDGYSSCVSIFLVSVCMVNISW